MEAFTLSAILQLINGDHPIPLNSSCEEISSFEESTEDDSIVLEENSEKISFYSKETSMIMSKDNKDKIQTFYQCNPDNWSISIREGSVKRADAEKAYEVAYKAAIENYGLAEIDFKKASFTYVFLKLFGDLSTEKEERIYPSAKWNIDEKNMAYLHIDTSFFPDSSNEEKWSVVFSISTNQQAECGDFFERKLCENR